MKRVNTLEITNEEAEVIMDFLKFLREEDVSDYDVPEVMTDIEKACLEKNSKVITINGILIVLK